ncbi:MAG: TRAP transporter substrate-binding protein [Anaerovoracaceae bacterium]
MFKKVLAVLLVVAMIFSFAACGNSDAGAEGGDDGQTYVLKFGSVVNEQHVAYKAMEKFKAELEEKSNGRIEVQLYGNSSLGSEREMLEGIAMGTIEMYYGGSMTLAGFTDDVKFQSLPFLFSGGKQAAFDFFNQFGDSISEEVLEQTGIRVIWTDNGEFNCLTKKPIYTVDDFKGLKVRCHEVDVMLEAYKALGANPTAMAFSEIYTALQQGTIQGTNTTALLVDTNAFYEQCEYYNNLHLFYDMGVTAVSEAWLKTLPEDLQQIVIDAANWFADTYNADILAAEEKTEAFLRDTITYVDYTAEELEPFIEAVQPAYDWFRENVDEPRLDEYLEALEPINAKYMK